MPARSYLLGMVARVRRLLPMNKPTNSIHTKWNTDN